MTDKSEFIYSEQRLAAVTGISHQKMVEVRRQHLQREEDYNVLSNHIAYSVDGVDRLLTALGHKLPKKKTAGGIGLEDILKASLVPTLSGAEQALELWGQGRDLIPWLPVNQLIEVILVPIKNTTIVYGEILESDLKPISEEYYAREIDGRKVVHVRVGRNKHFLPGMEMPCRHLHGPYWELTRRLPRGRGRW
jgi:hypothetical protein